jgi:hypothetical protein
MVAAGLTAAAARTEGGRAAIMAEVLAELRLYWSALLLFFAGALLSLVVVLGAGL